MKQNQRQSGTAINPKSKPTAVIVGYCRPGLGAIYHIVCSPGIRRADQHHALSFAASDASSADVRVTSCHEGAGAAGSCLASCADATQGCTGKHRAGLSVVYHAREF